MILPARVYYVECPTDDTVLMAMDIEINNNVKTVRWLDTVKERLMQFEKILDENPVHFVFERSQRERGGIYTFIPMTLEIYDQKVKNKVLIPKEFKSEDELFTEIEKTKKNIW